MHVTLVLSLAPTVSRSPCRAELDTLRADPPQWLLELRRNGPFPREVVAQKLGIAPGWPAAASERTRIMESRRSGSR